MDQGDLVLLDCEVLEMSLLNLVKAGSIADPDCECRKKNANETGGNCNCDTGNTNFSTRSMLLTFG